MNKAIIPAIVTSVFILIVFLLFKAIQFETSKEKCQYEGVGTSCLTQGEYCRQETRRMFMSITDTWGVDTNNQDQISKSMIEMYDRCMVDSKK
jgi:hypothetical protein